MVSNDDRERLEREHALLVIAEDTWKAYILGSVPLEGDERGMSNDKVIATYLSAADERAEFHRSLGQDEAAKKIVNFARDQALRSQRSNLIRRFHDPDEADENGQMTLPLLGDRP